MAASRPRRASVRVGDDAAVFESAVFDRLELVDAAFDLGLGFVTEFDGGSEAFALVRDFRCDEDEEDEVVEVDDGLGEVGVGRLGLDLEDEEVLVRAALREGIDLAWREETGAVVRLFDEVVLGLPVEIKVEVEGTFRDGGCMLVDVDDVDAAAEWIAVTGADGYADADDKAVVR